MSLVLFHVGCMPQCNVNVGCMPQCNVNVGCMPQCNVNWGRCAGASSCYNSAYRHDGLITQVTPVQAAFIAGYHSRAAAAVSGMPQYPALLWTDIAV